MFELVAGPGGPLEYPVPWPNHDDESWLVSAAEYRDHIESAGLDVAHWREGPAALEAIGAVAQSAAGASAAWLGSADARL